MQIVREIVLSSLESKTLANKHVEKHRLAAVMSVSDHT